MQRSPPRAAHIWWAAWLLLVTTGKGLAAERPSSLSAPRPSQSTEADLETIWKSWRSALSARRWSELEPLGQRLIELKEDLGIADLDAFSVEFIRTAETQMQEGQPALAVKLAQAATQLAPHLPDAHWALARVHFSNDVLDPSPYLVEAQLGFKEWWSDPRCRRRELADFGASLLYALVATVIVVLAMLSLRRWSYFLHDFNHLFPRGAGRWETSLLAAVVVVLPVIFHLGLVPLLLTILAASVFYLSTVERCIAGALIALLGLLPSAAGALAERASFSRTPAEDIYRLERGGPAAKASEQRVLKRVEEDRAEFAELFSLGRYELRQGRADQALRYLQQAALKRADNAPVLTNLGNAMFARGDLEGAADSYMRASQLDDSLAAPVLNLAKLYELRTRLTKPAGEGDGTGTDAARASPSPVGLRPPGRTYVNRMLISPAVPNAEISSLAESADHELKVQRQVTMQLLGNVEAPLSWLYPVIAALLLVAAGFAGQTLAVSTPCEKCGRPVCQRCDSSVVSGGMLCSQCVSVFVRSKDVPPELRVRKQLEVARHHLRFDKIAYVLGFLCSGAGHIYSGAPLTGAVYSFAFLFAFFRIVLRQGVLRLPYGGDPSIVGLLPIVLILIAVHLSSIRALHRLRS